MKNRPFLIGVAGASGSGKSQLAAHLASGLSAPVISLDSYYLELGHLTYEDRCRVNFDEPAALDSGLLHDHISKLAAGMPIDVPEYDFSRHTRAEFSERIVPGQFLILEGLFALYWENVRNLLDARIFVDLPDDICFARRLERDVRERGRTPESVREQYCSTVKPMCELYILPTRSYADVLVRGDANIQDSVAGVMAHCLRARSAIA